MKNKYPNKMNYPDIVIEKLWDRVKYPPDWETAFDKSKVCTEWDGRYDQYGRPVFKLNGVYVPAKNVMFESCYGPIEPGKIVLNTCYNKKCVRPDHLFQTYYFKKEVRARNGQRDPKDKRRTLKVIVTEQLIMKVFKAVESAQLKTVSEIGRFLNIDDEYVREFLKNDKWRFINNYYTKERLDELRSFIAGL